MIGIDAIDGGSLPDTVKQGDRIGAVDSDPTAVVLEVDREIGKAFIMFYGNQEVVSVPIVETKECGCGSDKVYHDTEEVWVCPFCDL